VALTESPFVNVLSSDRVSAISRQMGLPANANLTAGQARELCQRAGSKMYVAGSIGSADSKYVVGIARSLQRMPSLPLAPLSELLGPPLPPLRFAPWEGLFAHRSAAGTLAVPI